MQIYMFKQSLISLHKISNMYVYSDIVKLSAVGNSQVPSMGFFPIKSNFQEKGH